MAIATLGISSEEFYDLSPVEFYYALQHASEHRRAQSRELYEISRFGAVIMANAYLGKHGYTTAQDCVQFEWEKKVIPKKQSVDEMKAVIMTIGRANKAEFKKRE